MDIVYPLGKGSIYKNFELRMSLRSVVKHMQGVDRVFIVGELPSWIQNVEHIPASDSFPIPDRNIYNKILLACHHDEISDEFLFMNDDHYLLSGFDINTFPYYYSEEIAAYLKRSATGGSYRARVCNTLEHLQLKQLPTRYYDIHYPVRYEKEKFIKSTADLSWEQKKDGYVLKSIYCNSNEVAGEQQKDYKVNSAPSMAKAFSSFSNMRKAVTRFLIEQFPKQSTYEKSGI